MSKLLKVTMEYDDHYSVIEGEEAEIWLANADSLCVMAANRAGNQNPFDHRPTKWVSYPKIHEDAYKPYLPVI